MACFPYPENDEFAVGRLSTRQVESLRASTDLRSIAQLAALLCDAPTACINFLDEDRQRTISLWGVEVDLNCRRQDAFCTRLEGSSTALVVPDATVDPGFAKSPLVDHPEGIRFYAGAPLITRDGCFMGSLCVLDTQPRSIPHSQREGLMLLARQAVAIIEQHEAAYMLADSRYGQAKAEIERQEADYLNRRILASIPSILLVVDANGLISKISKAAEDAFGLSEETWLGKRFDTLSEPFSPLILAVSKCLNRRKSWPFQFKLVTGEKPRDLAGAVHILQGQGNSAPAALIFAADVTERNAAQRQLEQREAFLSAVMTSSQVGFLAVDESLDHLIYCNEHFQRMWLGPREVLPDSFEGIAEQLRSVVTEPDTLRNWWRAQLSGESDSHPEGVFNLKNGKTVSLVTSPICRGGQTFGRLLVSTDITDLAQAEASLREIARRDLEDSKEKLQFIVNSAPVLVLAVSEAGIYELCEGKALDGLGLLSSDLVGRSIHDVLPECPDLRANFEQAMLGDSHSVILRMGASVFEAHFCPIRTEGDRYRVQCLALDITQRHHLEEQLSLAQKLESIGLLAAGIAHEINTPMQYIGDNNAFLADSLVSIARFVDSQSEVLNTLSSGHSEEFERIASLSKELSIPYLLKETAIAVSQTGEGIDRVRHIVQGLKELCHMGTGELTPTDIEHAIENTLTVAMNEYKYVASIERHFQFDLPMVSCLPWDFKQVILILIVNAAHAIADCVKEGKYERGVIKIEAHTDEESLVVKVADNCIGISSENLGKIFLPFFTTKKEGKGSGQGLSIAHSIIREKHKGTIECSSALGEGTTFTIRIPIGAADNQLQRAS